LLCGILTACEAVPADVPTATIQNTPEIASAPSVAVPPPAPKIDTPEPTEMIGWNETKIATVLGSASLVRRDLGSKIWQYQTPDCVLFLFLYPDGGVSKIKHVDARSTGTGNIKTCVTSVLRQRQSAESPPSAPRT
tara:strand:- start:11195 stop:11602 length:408 start_codon:yes stop_codon:yes gene_type:complete